MASIADIDETVRAYNDAGGKNLILLKCTSSYPATPEDSNIKTIPHLKKLFGCEVGLSDQTMGLGVSIAAVSLGATLIEKHFTLDRSEGGVDSAFSLEPDEMKALVIETKRAWQGLGKVIYGPTKNEKKSMQFRRSLYIIKNLKSGEILSEDSVKAIRPGYGLPPKYYDIVVGKSVNQNIEIGTPLTWDLIF